MATRIKVSIKIGSNGMAVVTKSGESNPIVVDVLATEKDACGRDVVYLRNMIHSTNKADIVYEGWSLTGAISTIMTQILESDNVLA